MKNKLTLSFALFFATILSVNAQKIKVDNLEDINHNTLIEQEMGSKGAPQHVALKNVNIESPLNSPVQEGTVVFSKGGAVRDGYYYWNGGKWVMVMATPGSATKLRVLFDVEPINFDGLDELAVSDDPSSEVKIFDYSGRLVAKENTRFADLPNGVYTMNILTENESRVVKFVKS